MRTRLHLAVVCFVISAVVVAVAELRSPTAAEKAALDKYASVVNQVLDQFQSDDWTEKVDYSLDDPEVNTNDPGVPLDINELTQRSYTVRYGSKRWNEKLAPLTERIMASNDWAEKGKIGEQMSALQAVRVEVHFNRANIGFDPEPDKNQDLHIPGAAFAYNTGKSPTGHGTSYLLAFGNWSNSKWDADHRWYQFHFAHPQNTPYIENIEVEIYGADDHIQQLLHSIDWKQMNDGLTR
jgi:hypothetical protein